MGLYNFQKRFVPFILSGAKRHWNPKESINGKRKTER